MSVSVTASKPVPGLTSPSSYSVRNVLEAYEVGRWPVISTYELKVYGCLNMVSTNTISIFVIIIIIIIIVIFNIDSLLYGYKEALVYRPDDELV